jgi:hypothetical protein
MTAALHSAPPLPAPGPPARFGRALVKAAGQLEALDPFELISVLSLFLLMLYGGDYWYLRVPLTIVAIAAMMHPPLRRAPETWFCLSAILLVGNLTNWYVIDNHKYLITYWCLAVSIAHCTANPQQTLARSARLLIGLAFLFAVFWKAVSPDYPDGAFFHQTLLTDRRFTILARLAGLSRLMTENNARLVDSLTGFDAALTTVALHSNAMVATVARFMTWWTLAIEAVTAAAFLVPTDWRLARYRDPVLILFLLSTYSLAPVIGFGWVLAIMGAAQASDRPRFARLGYVAALFMLQVYRVPWKSFFIQ